MPPTKRKAPDAPTVTAVTEKKRRGRKPSVKAATTAPAPASASEAGAGGAKKRGRPPKQKAEGEKGPASTPAAAEVAAAEVATAEVAAPVGVKKRVGRPPKTQSKPAQQPEPSQQKPKPQQNAGASEAADQEEEEAEGEDDGRCYWLMKAEPESRLEKGVDVKFSIDDLRAATEPEPWDGVRNAVARNNLRAMRKGDYAFFYHSNCKVPGIVGTMEIVQEHSVDETAFDPKHPYHDPKSTRDQPKWEVVHVIFRSRFKSIIPLDELKSHGVPGGPLEKLQTLKQTRLSVSAVTPKQWHFIQELAEEEE